MSARQRAKRRTKSDTHGQRGSSDVFDRRARRTGYWPKRGWKTPGARMGQLRGRLQ